jgi:hypothetical protein
MSQYQTRPTLPHERELLDLVKLVMEAYEADDPNYLCLVITDHREHMNFLIQRLRDATQWDMPDTKIFRDGVSVKGGGKVVVMSTGDPGRLMGMHPNKIVLFGRVGELWYWMNSMNCEIGASA